VLKLDEVGDPPLKIELSALVRSPSCRFSISRASTSATSPYKSHPAADEADNATTSDLSILAYILKVCFSWQKLG
jgi:hypothetical protein